MKQKDLAKFYDIPHNSRGDKETTSKDELEDIFFKTGDRVLENVIEFRSLSTTINNYIPNWEPARDGRVHTTWGYTSPTGQLDARQPNILNCSKHTEIGQLFRRMIEAPEGYCFVEADKRSFHVATKGYCAENRDYIRFSQLDPHSIFTSYIMPQEWGRPIDLGMEDGEILERCRWIKKRCKEEKAKDPIHGVDIRQDLAKPVVLGNQLGLGPRKLYWQNRRYIGSERRAKDLQIQLAELFDGKISEWDDYIRDKAYQQTYLYLSEWGRIQYFFDVFNWRYNKKSREWVKGHGSDSEKVLAFPVQGEAFGMIQWELRKIDRLEGCEKYNFVVPIHDSLMFMPRVGDRDKCVEMLWDIMNRPCKRMVNKATGDGGLRVGIEIAVGRNWQGYDYFGKGSNPEGMQEIKI